MRKIYSILLTAHLLFLCGSQVYAQKDNNSFLCFQPSPKREVRAVWLTTIGGIDWPHSYAQSETSARKQKAELCHLLDKYVKAGINTILIQTRIRGTVIYPSVLEPWDGCLSGFPGKSPGYDALQFAIDECHKRGLEIHAWVVTIPVGKWNALGCRNLRKKYPGLIVKIGSEGYMNPEDSRTATYLADFCEEITRHYDIDGINLDYIRYPETWNKNINSDRGRQCITAIAQAIHDKVKEIKPWVKMSCSPIGKFDDLSRYWSHGWNAYTKVCQDAQGWLKTGVMDELFPMMYFRGDQFFPFAIDWSEQKQGKIVAPGLGIYFLSPREGNWKLSDVTREMQVMRQYNLGHAFFRGKFFTDDTQGIYSFAKLFNNAPALVPAMTWIDNKKPATPQSITIDTDRGISWKGSTPFYNIYSSRSWPVDTDDPQNLIAIRRSGNTLQVDTRDRYFAITGMDRFGNESDPLQSHLGKTELKEASKALLICNKSRLLLPKKPTTIDADLVVVESLQGNILATFPYSTSVNIESLPNGWFVVKSINRKGITHRLGFVKIDKSGLDE